MLSSNLYLLATGLTLSTAFARPNLVRRDETPQLPHDPNTTPYCTWWADDDGSIDCAGIPGYWGISMDDFVRWNPSVGNDCAGFVSGNSYCVEAYGEPAPGTGTTTTKVTTTSSASTSSTSTSTTTSTTTTTGGAPGPTQPGQVTNCNKWDLVQTGDTCSVYLAKYPGLTLAKLVEWNPAIGSQCESLWTETYICTGVIGWTPSPTTSKATTTSTTPTNGVTTPQPIQPGMITDCNKFHMVAEGDGCDSIAKANGLTPAQFYALNPGVGNTCSTLWLGYYVCVSRIGTSPTTTKPTTTKPGNGITTPTPIQDGMVGNCDKFHLVGDNDQCVTIARSNGISLSQFYSWNPSVGKGCETLWNGYYVCVKIVGVNPITTTTTKATTTTKGNGIATPTPIQPGMITSCKKFHKVVEGDQCGTIAAAAGITQSQFNSWNPNVGADCKSLWLGYWGFANADPRTEDDTPPVNWLTSVERLDERGVRPLLLAVVLAFFESDGCRMARLISGSIASPPVNNHRNRLSESWQPGFGNDREMMRKITAAIKAEVDTAAAQQREAAERAAQEINALKADLAPKETQMGKLRQDNAEIAGDVGPD